MTNKLKRIILISGFSLLLLQPGTCFAWHDYNYSGWNWYGSGRDHPYSYYVDNYYSPRYVDYYSVYAQDNDYLNYINGTVPAPVPPPPSSTPGEYNVNVPNSHGGYTAVMIKSSGNGYVGPQGEYYSQFPKVSQLELMYSK